MSRMTLMTVAGVFGLSLVASGEAADYRPLAPVWSSNHWNGWSNNQRSNQLPWWGHADREELHRRSLRPADEVLHRGMGDPTRPQPRDRVRIPYNSYGPAAAYDARYSPNHRSPDWPSWPLPSYQFGGTMPIFSGYGR